MKKMNNKGFSVVELIIVIAIMAILIGVLAPQYIKYVEKSRISADEDCADALKNAIMTATTDDDFVYKLSNGDKVTFNQANGVTPYANNGSSVATAGDGTYDALQEYFAKWSQNKVKSKSYRGSTWTVLVSEDSHNVLKVIASWNP